LPGARSPAWDPRELQAALCAAVIAGSTVVAPPPALAVTDSAAIGKCLIKNCPTQLARCVSDPVCAANLLCIQTCTDRKDESECQIKCGDEFANKVVDKFTSCAVSSKNCVPQRQDDGSWPVPTEAALVPFSPGMFTGDWYISAGLNKAFDTFDCQFHKFTSPAPNKFVGDLQWRIKNPLLENDFSTKTTIQEFIQDPKVPGILYNHDNEFLHYQDDWYVLAAKEDAYFVVYYRGSNDAWDGYGGAFVYSRSPKFPKQYSKEIDESLQKIGRSLKEFTFTDNTCKGKPTVTEELVFVESRVATGVASAETSFVDELTKDIQIAKDDVILAEKELAKDIRIVEDDIIAVEKELEKDVVNVEQEIVRDEQKFLNLFFKR
jgi:violaxanthin de-epoxidase